MAQIIDGKQLSLTLKNAMRDEVLSLIAGYITPVPGGVGPMTIAMLMRNTIDCFIQRQQEKQ